MSGPDGAARLARSRAIASMASGGRQRVHRSDPARRGAARGHTLVLVAQPVDHRPAVEDDCEVFTSGRVPDGCRQRIRFKFVDSSVKVSSRRGWAALQVGSAAQARKRLSKPACVLKIQGAAIGTRESCASSAISELHRLPCHGE